MKKTGRRIWYGIAMFLSGLVLLLSVVGIAGVWIAERALGDTAVQVLVAVEDVTGSIRQVTQGVDQRLERMQAVTIFISTASAKLSQKVTDEGLIKLILPEEKEQNLIEMSTSVKEAISPLRDMLSAGLVIYRSINQLPFVELPTPSLEQADKIESSVGEIQSASDNLEAEIAAFRSGAGDQIGKVETGADSLTSRLGDARDRLAELDARLVIAQEALVRLQKTVVSALMVASILITLLLVWVMYSQVEVLRLYRLRWKATGTIRTKEEPPDRTAGLENENVVESGSVELVKPDI